MDRASGELLRGRYRLGPLLGEGATGHRRLAADTLLGREVAVKILKPAYAGDATLVARFYAEARAAAALVDPHVVGVYDVLAEDDLHAIVMEFVDGPSLAAVLRANGPLGEARAVAYGRQIAGALAAAHARGLLHRDIKPANLLLAPGDTIKVADFGLAKALAGTDPALTEAGRLIGSAAYFSPEQAQGLAARAGLRPLQPRRGALPVRHRPAAVRGRLAARVRRRARRARRRPPRPRWRRPCRPAWPRSCTACCRKIPPPALPSAAAARDGAGRRSPGQPAGAPPSGTRRPWSARCRSSRRAPRRRSAATASAMLAAGLAALLARRSACRGFARAPALSRPGSRSCSCSLGVAWSARRHPAPPCRRRTRPGRRPAKLGLVDRAQPAAAWIMPPPAARCGAARCGRASRRASRTPTADSVLAQYPAAGTPGAARHDGASDHLDRPAARARPARRLGVPQAAARPPRATSRPAAATKATARAAIDRRALHDPRPARVSAKRHDDRGMGRPRIDAAAGRARPPTLPAHAQRRATCTRPLRARRALEQDRARRSGLGARRPSGQRSGSAADDVTLRARRSCRATPADEALPDEELSRLKIVRRAATPARAKHAADIARFLTAP